MTHSSERIGLSRATESFRCWCWMRRAPRGYEVVVAAIKEETFPEIEQHGAAAVHWLSLGEL